MSAELTQRKDFSVRDHDLLLRWIVSGPAGCIELYAPVDSDLASPNAEIHRHALAPGLDYNEAHREDCDLIPGGGCYFSAWWGMAARKAYGRSDEDIWEFLRYAYGEVFHPDVPTEEPEWSR